MNYRIVERFTKGSEQPEYEVQRKSWLWGWIDDLTDNGFGRYTFRTKDEAKTFLAEYMKGIRESVVFSAEG